MNTKIKKNDFDSILEKNGWEDKEEKPVVNNYVPTFKTLIKIEEDNLPLIHFLQKLNPFQEISEDFKTFHDGLYSIKAPEFKKVFPLNTTVIKKLGPKGTNIVLDKWKNDGVIRNILKHKELLLPSNRPDITANEILEVFVEATMRMTNDIVFSNKRYFDVNSYMGDISFHAARITTDFHPYFKGCLREQWLNKIMRQDYTFTDIASYRICKYAFLDELLLELFESKNITNLKILKNIEDFLPFVHLSKKTVLEKSKIVFEEYVELIKELKEQANIKEQYKLTEYYFTTSTEDKRKIDYECRAARVKSEQMKNLLISVLKIFAKI